MRLRSLFALMAGLLAAGTATAQTPAVAPVSPVVPPALSQENVWNLDLSTGGRVSIQLRPDIAPNHVERIKTLTRQGFYNGTVFHRVIEGFMAQGGDPTATGTGGSKLPDLASEFNILPHVRGTVSAARSDDSNSANSQFFIMLSPRLSLDNHYSAFGRVISGMNFVDAIPKGEPPAEPARILRASIGSDNVPPPKAGEIIPVVNPVVPLAATSIAPAAAKAAAPDKPKDQPQP